MKNQIFAVIMAGGSGTRFWPKSRAGLPKQFLKIIGDKTMLQSTVHRVEPIISHQNIFIITNVHHAQMVKEQLPSVPSENIFLEPVGRNTAPCIGIAALMVQQRDPEGVMIVLPSDHCIKNKEGFCKELKIAAERAAEKKTLISFGIKPTYPETGYGYIQCGEKSSLLSEYEIYQIERFREKPDINQAKEFIKCGNYFWNAGIFVWKASVILEEIEKYLPESYKKLMEIKKHLETNKAQEEINNIFKTFQPESIDYGVMEKTERAEIIASQVDWNDVGSWKSLENLLPSDESGNITDKMNLLIDTSNSIIKGNRRLIAAIGLKDMVVIDTEDVLLICPKERCQEVKTLVERLKEERKDEYL